MLYSQIKKRTFRLLSANELRNDEPLKKLLYTIILSIHFQLENQLETFFKWIF
jgi:hypothetical protein